MYFVRVNSKVTINLDQVYKIEWISRNLSSCTTTPPSVDDIEGVIIYFNNCKSLTIMHNPEVVKALYRKFVRLTSE